MGGPNHTRVGQHVQPCPELLHYLNALLCYHMGIQISGYTGATSKSHSRRTNHVSNNVNLMSSSECISTYYFGSTFVQEVNVSIIRFVDLESRYYLTISIRPLGY